MSAIEGHSAQRSRTIGRYEIRDALGGGGMGEVYRVFDPVRRRELALKVLQARWPQALRYFKREFRAIARLSHRNLVRLYDLHFEQGRYFYTMDLVEGSDLTHYVDGPQGLPADDALLPRALMHPRRVQRLRDAFVQLLMALAYLHDHGRVHSDIKPSNILVDNDGRVQLVDFGIVRELDTVQLQEQQPSQVFGTAVYMSPEQSIGSPKVTPASDLYAAGVVLYEQLAGRPPFQADDDNDILVMHHRNPPPSLRDAVPGIPEDLERLCLALLSKGPEARPGAREAIEMIGGEADAEISVDPFEFVGRRQVRKSLISALDAIRDRGEGRAVFVEGRPGVGRTALLRAFAHEARVYGATAVMGSCVQRDHVPARGLDTVVERLAEGYRRQASELLRQIPPRQRAGLLEVFPFLADLLPEDLPVTPQQRGGGEAAAAEGLKALVGGLARDRLLILIVDDLHFADPLAARLIEALQHEIRRLPLMLLMSVDSTRLTPEVQALVELAEGSEVGALLTLGPLSADETEAMLKDALDSMPPPDVVSRLHLESEGNPYYLSELVLHFKRHPDAQLTYVSLEDLLRQEIAGLDGPSRRVVASVALSPFPVPSEVLERATDLPPSVLYAAIDRLVAQGTLHMETRGERGLVLRMPHQRLKQLAEEALSLPLRAQVHDLLGEAYAALGGPVEAVAFHWEAAGTPDRAARFAVEAAARARAAEQPELTAAWLRLALETPPPSVPLQQLRLWLVEALSDCGRYEEAAEALQPLIADEEGAGRDRWITRQLELHLMAGNLQAVAPRLDRIVDGKARVRLADLLLPLDPLRAEEMLGQADSPFALMVRARLLSGENRQRSVSRADRLLRKAQEGVEALAGDEAHAYVAARALTEVAVRQAEGRFAEAMGTLEDLLAADHGMNRYDLNTYRVRLAQGTLALSLGRLPEARSLGQALLREARARKLLGGLAQACTLMARVHMAAGDHRLAARLLDEGDAVWSEAPPAMPQVWLALARARLALYRGAPEETIRLLRALRGDADLEPLLARREPAGEVIHLMARAHAVMALAAWREQAKGAAEAAREQLMDMLRLQRRAVPTPETWLEILTACGELVGGSPRKATTRLANLTDPYEHPLLLAIAAGVLAAARDALNAGDGVTDSHRAESLLSKAGAALPPELAALRPPPAI